MGLWMVIMVTRRKGDGGGCAVGGQGNGGLLKLFHCWGWWRGNVGGIRDVLGRGGSSPGADAGDDCSGAGE